MALNKHTLSEQRKRLRAAATEELRAELATAQRELVTLRYQLSQAGGQLENPMRVRQVRKLVARIHTMLKERGRKNGDLKV
jgi:large subunit ribosomal protein L29